MDKHSLKFHVSMSQETTLISLAVNRWCHAFINLLAGVEL